MQVLESSAVPASRHILALLLLYGAASLLHFAHNAEYLTEYPNLPAWLSRSQIYLVWACITALGAVGYLIYRRAHEISGLIVIAIYASLGFDGLLHYSRAPMGQHTSAMNMSIWFEVLAAALLFGVVLTYLARYSLRRGRVS